ncbi:hypothetical protein IWW34DRAFT_903772 [Fusarium oxysporum f. sp. albedinis]|nr:hypothetical protein IWW34DRAFT_903772 [Fusarium oxysporum f. sp. albedinis]
MFTSLLKRVQRQTAESMPFDHLGMHKISKLSPACQRATRFQSLLVIQSSEDPLLNSALFTPDPTAPVTPMTYALTLKVRLGRDKINVLAQYDDRVLSVVEVRRLLSRWESLIQVKNATVADIIGHNVVVTEEATCPPVVPNMSQPMAQPRDAQAYWSDLFAGPAPAKFPLLPSVHYRPVSTQELRMNLPIDYGCAIGDIQLITLLRGVWGLVMSLYSNSLDITFGMTLHGHTVPVRLQLSEGKQDLMQFFVKIQKEAEVMEPFIQFGLRNIGALSYQAEAACQFQSVLAIVDDGQESGEVGSMGSLATFALALIIIPRTQHFELCARFDPHVLSPIQTRRLLSQYTHGLQQCCKGQWKQMAVQDINWTGPEDIHTIQSWNVRQTREPMAQSILSKFDEVTELYHNMTAIDSWDGTFTYAELDQNATVLAHLLIDKGVKSETVVAICLHKSKWAIVAMLAVLKAGATVVFLDPSHPIIRLQAILDLTHAYMILASSQTGEELRHGDVPVMDVVDFAVDHVSVNSRCLPDVSPSTAAFIVSTSGTTGKPKAIVLEHGAVCVSALSVAQMAGITPGIRFFQFANYTFDVSYGDMLGTLLYGGCLSIPSEDERLGDLTGAIVRSRASVTTLTPTVAALLRPSELPELRTMILAGEAITSNLIEKWASCVNLTVLYGPAEATIYSTGQAHLARTDPSGIIGRALGCTTWVLDANHCNECVLAPVGAVGELAIEGSIVSRGYLDNPVEMQASFVSAVNLMPGAPPSHHRLYRTGDLVRYLEDGRLQYIGRRDQQVKLYGQRIAPEAVECEIQRLLPAKVQTAVLVVTPKDHDQPLLVATICIKPRSPDHGTLCVLRGSEIPKELASIISLMPDQLRASLPSYMVPSVFLPISNIPWTGSGKMDYVALRTCCQDLKRGELLSILAPPPQQLLATSAERILARAWAEVLGCGLETLDAKSDFLELGGNSLHAILLVTSLRRRGFRLPVKDTFAHPQLSSMASLLDVSIESEVVKPFSMCPHTVETVQLALEEQRGEPSRVIEDIYPCSPLQAGLMALSLTEPRSYLAKFTYQPPTGINMTQFRAAWETVYQRSPILRTRIVLLEEMMQVVVEDQISWLIVDDLDQYLATDRDSPFGLGQPLIRFALNGDAVVLTIHHALYDGWSLSALLDDVSKISRGLNPNPHVPYKVFIHHLQAMDRTAAIRFWSERLDKAPASAFPVLPSPGYRPYADQRYELITTLPPRKPSHLTQATVFRTAWALLMARYASMTDVVFGNTLTGRTLPIGGVETIDGPTIATVPVRVAFKLDQTVHSLLESVQRDGVETIPFEQLGMQEIKKVSEAARQACGFQSMLTIQNYKPANKTSEASVLKPQHARVNLSHLLSVDVTPMGSEVEFLARFDGQVLGMQQVRRLLYQMHHVITQLWNVDSRTTVRDIELLSHQDRQDIARWNDYPVEAIESDLPTLIAQRTFTQPASPAVRAWDGDLTYLELQQLSDNVAICFEKSAWTVVAMLGILKTGATVVPLDAKHPVGRIATIVQTAKANLMVASALQAPRFQDQGWDIVTLSPAKIQAFEPPVNPLPAITASDVALIMFTSGSTGVPKGILMDHRCLCSSIVTHSSILGIPPHINVLQYSAYTFDHSIFEIYTTLVTGGCVCVLSDDERMNSLVDSMRRLEIDWVFFTPSIAKLIHVDDVPTLTTLYVGGEPVTRSLIDDWAAAKTLINGYGPAECSMMSSCVMTVDSPAGTIGRPQAGRTWIVEPDDYNRLAPVGAMGEMVYEGPMVARGYLHETPSSGFIKRPKWASTDTPFRFYRTGDLGRYESDGSLVFGGRKDTQIKLRGQRVEPGEVESQIQKLLPTTAIAVEVVVAADGDGTPSLAAFLVVVGDDFEVAHEPMDLIDVSQEAKRRIGNLVAGVEEALLRTLPEYMVPTVFLPLRRLPLTTSGKVDRKVLRQLGKQLTVARLASLTTAAEYSPPMTDEEVILQGLWSTVLHMNRTAISANNSFLRLGGDSITAIRLVRATREAGFRLDVDQIFQSPILHEMASNMRPISSNGQKVSTSIPPFSLLRGPIDTLVSQLTLRCQVEPSSIEDIYPCTAMQSGLMFLSAREPGTYIAQTTYRLTQPFSKFRTAWSALAALTPLLRTCIVQHESDYLQVVLKDVSAINKVDKIDASFLDTERQQLTQGRVLSRLASCESPDGITRVVFTLHHAVYDGWSQALLMGRLQNLLMGRPVAPSPPFTHFISHIQSASAADAEGFWRRQLENAVPVSFPQLPILGYRPNPMTLLDHHIAQTRILASDFTESTRIRASWALLISRYLDQRHVTIGVTANGRGASVAGIDQILAPMLTTVPVTIDTDRSIQVSEFLSAIQKQAIDMQAYEQYGLQHIAAINDKMRAVCDFHSLLVIHHKGAVPQDQVKPFWIPEPDCDKRPFHGFALSMECTVQRDGVAVHATYDEKVIDSLAMRRLVHQFEYILKQLGAPNVLSYSLNDIELISPVDRAELACWNAFVPAPTMDCIHHLVASQLKERPEAPALASWEGGFTFRQLDTFASSLAEHLRETGDIGPGVLVPLLFEKSIYTVVTMLAVLKAGGACAALDPAHPTERLRGIVEDIQANVVLSSTANLGKAVDLRLRVVAVDQALLDKLVTTPLKLPPSTVGPEDPAIILFTSGSTGKPKGIVIDHRAFASSIRGHSETLRYRAGSRNFQFTAYTSDVSYGEIFTSLSVGACVCIPSDDERVNDLAGAMERLRVDWAFLTPSVASILDPQAVPTLRTLVFGGETVSAETVRLWAEVVYLINSFGPAECSIWNCCSPGIGKDHMGSNIGKGLGCAQWIVEPDNEARLAPIGTVGELVVEGPNVARGYLGLPDKTKAVFIACPPWVPEDRRATSRLYKTGDLARFLPNGDVQFLGRRDTQVKLHGQRLELGEVEHQLRQYLPRYLPEVAAEMVSPAGGTDVLAVFVNIRPILTEETSESSDLAISDAAIDWLQKNFPGLESALTERLPRFMIPSLMIPLNRMPLSASAKTDRGRLKQIALSMTSEEVARLHACRIARYTSPSTARERRLQQLWAKVLNLEPSIIGRSDQFFHLGGNSMRAMQLVTLARKDGLSLSVQVIFDNPQLSAMALAMKDLDSSGTDPVRPFSLLPTGEDLDTLRTDAAQQCGLSTQEVVDLYPCTPLQAGLMAQSLKHPGTYVGHITRQIPANIDIHRFCGAWATVVERYILLRTRIIQASVGLLQVAVSSDADLVWRSPMTVQDFMDQTRSMGLGQPLVQFGLIESERIFLLTLHHALYDMWTLDLLFESVQAVYENHQEPEILADFRHFIQHIQVQSQETSRRFWVDQLANAPTPSFPHLPSVRYIPSTDSVFTYNTSLPPPTSAGILNSTILTASWAAVVARHSDVTSDAIFGATYSGRSAPVPGVEQIMGPTIATVPFRLRMDKELFVHTFLSDVQRQATAIIAHEQYGLPKIRAINERALDFQSLLVIQISGQPSIEAWLAPVQGGHGQQTFHNYALSVECTMDGPELRITCNFDSRVLAERQLRRIMGQFIHVIQQLSSPKESQKLSEIQLTTPEDLIELAQWNNIEPGVNSLLVHQLVHQMAMKGPTALAIDSWDRKFTYAELENISKNLASALVAQGVIAGDAVPLLFEKSSWAIVAMLATLKAGASCVALDPTQNVDDLWSSISQVQGKILLTSDRQYGLVEHLEDCGLILRINHGSTSRNLQFAAFTSFMSIGEIFTSLSLGACVCIPSDEEYIQDLAGAMRRMEITWAFLTPTIASSLSPDLVPTLKTLVLGGGDIATHNVIEEWANSVYLINTIGYAECSVWTHCAPGISAEHDPSNVGRQTSSSTWIVDPADPNCLAPIGSMGEMLIESPDEVPGVNEGIITVSLIERKRTVYRTGALARYLPDGCLQVLGQCDKQVKMRGQRIDLSEIEHALRKQLPALRDIVVTMVHPSSEEAPPTLAAFFNISSYMGFPTPVHQMSSARTLLANSTAAKRSAAALLEGISSRLGHMLPVHMLPSLYIPLWALPVSESANIDYGQLQSLAAELSVDEVHSFSFPTLNRSNRKLSTPSEEAMATLWMKTLHLDSVSADDHFISRGGDSLAAMRMVRDAQAVGFTLSVAIIFQHPILSEMATAAQTPMTEELKNTDNTSDYSVPPPFSTVGAATEDVSQLRSYAAKYLHVDDGAIEDILPCSPLQEGLIALSVQQPGSYIAQFVYRLPASVDLELLQSSWQTVVDSSPILRSRIIPMMESTNLMQVVLRASVSIIHWENASELESYLAKHQATGMSIGDVLLRLAYISEHGEGRLVLTMHHAVYDEHSLQLLWRSVESVYSGLGVPNRTQFSSFIHHIQDLDTESTVAFWKSELEGTPAPSFPSLPSAGSPFQARPDKKLQATLSLTHAHNTHITSAGVIRAAYSLWLSIHTGSDDVVFGVTMSGRTAPMPGIEAVEGPTIATMPIRIRYHRDQTVGDYLQQVQQQAASMLPFEQTGLQNIKKISDDARIACNFRTLLVIQVNRGDVSDSITKLQSDLDCPLLPGVASNATFHTLPLILGCSLSTSGQVNIELLYDSRVSCSVDAERMLHQFQYILRQLATSPSDLALGDMEIISPDEIATVRRCNSQPLPTESACVFTRLVEISQKNPDSQAIMAYDGRLTYYELVNQALLVSQCLSRAGVDAGTMVPICFERSSWAIVAMLGVWMTGAAFVPLNPLQPKARLQDIISQCSASIALVSTESRANIEPLLQVLEISRNTLAAEKIYGHTTSSGLQPADPRAPAYVLFTSGSTGQAKGVVVDHQTLYISLTSHLKPLQLGQQTRFLHFTSYTFDISIAEIFDTLLAGGCVCAPSPDVKLIGAAMETMHVNAACFTPSMVQHIRPEEVPSLRTLVLGGEAVHQEHIDTWANHVSLFVGYGLTETCILATLQRFPPTSPDTRKTSICSNSIGSAIACRTWIVDPDNHHRLVPLGAVGELLINGPILAREYLHDTVRTAAAFVSEPQFGPGRCFVTGDLVQYDSQGSLKYIGRKDSTVKLRGQRLDLTEVEFRVKQAFVDVSDLTAMVINRRGTPSLAVFFCPKTDKDDQRHKPNISPGNLTSEQLVICRSAQTAVAKYLPAFMVPSLWVPINSMPLTASGKLDRARLQQAFNTAPEALQNGYALAHTSSDSISNFMDPMQISLRAIWATIFGLDPSTIRPNESFFVLGGDSLSVIRLVTMTAESGISLSAQQAFNSPTLIEMAHIATYQEIATDADDVPEFSLISSPKEAVIREACRQCDVTEDEIADIYPSTHHQDGLMVVSIRQPGTYIANFALSLPDNIDLAQYRASWAYLVSQLPILRTRIIHTADAGFQQVVTKSDMQWIEFESETLEAAFARQRELMGTAVGHPLSQYAVVHTPNQDRVFLWTAHHSIYDGWTVSKVFSLVDRIYSDIGINTPPKLLKTSAKRFNHFIHYLREQSSEQLVDYWSNYLAGVPLPSFPEIPSVEYQPVANAVLNHEVLLDTPLVTLKESITMATKLRATWGVLLGLYENSRDVTFGTTLSGRNSGATGISSIMGPTITTVPIRVKMPDPTSPVSSWLETVQQQAVEMIPFEQVGLQRIRRLNTHARSVAEFRSLFLVQSTRLSDAAEQNHQGLNLDGQLASFYTYPLVITCIMRENSSVLLTVAYDDNILDHCRVERLLDQFANLLRQLHEAPPQLSFSQLDMLPDFDAQQISSWNSSSIPIENCLVHQDIHKMAHLQPEQPAITAWDGNLSYAELDSNAKYLARYLRQAFNIGPEDKIPFCLDKSRWSVVVMLGILQAGGVVVGLNPLHPPKHRSQVLSQVKPKVIITTPAYATLFKDYPAVLVSSSNGQLHIMPPIDSGDEETESMLESVGPDNAAFVVFTSGTTGVPKGIVLEHRAVCTSARAHGRLMKVTASSRVLQFAAHACDVIISDIFTTLLHGGCVCVPSEHDRMNNLAGAINSLNVTQAYLTTTLASQLLPDQVPGLQVLSVGGERVTEYVVNTWATHVHLINIYGPSECSVWSAGIHVAQTDAMPSNIGRGVGARLWLVSPNDHRLLVPIGTIGELFIDGPILAREYLSNPDLTTSSFIDDAPWLAPGRRAYKTGDLVRYTTNGTIEYLYRRDGQVKLHGQRMELDAVGYHLRACLPDDYPAAAEILSLPGYSVLAGFIALGEPGQPVCVLRDSKSLDLLSQLLSTMSNDLAARIPQFMVPTVFFPISSIPLTLTGKTDRQTLRTLGSELSPEDVRTFNPQWGSKQPPATGMEEILQALWASIIKIRPDSIDRNDNFLRLGGDSISAMRLVAAAREAKLYLTVAAVFSYPTLSEMAKHIIPLGHVECEALPFSLAPTGNDLDTLCNKITELCQVQRSQIQDIYPCTTLQQHYIELSTRSPGTTTLQNTYTIPSSVDVGRLCRAWEHVVASNSLLRTRIIYDPKAIGVWQVVLDEMPTWCTAPSLEAYYAQEVADPMGSGSSLSRCAIIDGRYFVWTCNHAIYDAWSIRLVMGQLEQSYQGLSLPLEAPFALLIQHLQSIDPAAADTFWQKALDNCQARPLYERGPAQVDSILALEMAMPVRSCFTQITTSTLIQVAWAIVLARETASRDVVFGLTVTGRDTPVPGVERMTGPVITTIPLRISVNEEQSVESLLQDVQAFTKAAIPYQHIGMPRIRNVSMQTAQACDATIPIDINVDNHHKEALGSAIGLERSQRTPLAESPMPFFLDCSASKHSLDVYVTFDSHILSRSRIQIMLSRFRCIMFQLCLDAVGKTVGSLLIEERTEDSSDSKILVFETHSGMGFDARMGEAVSMVRES